MQYGRIKNSWRWVQAIEKQVWKPDDLLGPSKSSHLLEQKGGGSWGAGPWFNCLSDIPAKKIKCQAKASLLCQSQGLSWENLRLWHLGRWPSIWVDIPIYWLICHPALKLLSLRKCPVSSYMTLHRHWHTKQYFLLPWWKKMLRLLSYRW